ncbi:MAG: FKBP-type peptidyl-prolyl cis-trans isomerase [Sandaracinaceae bacterium]|nr:FKBP-type peptidyl-prolyl cis-trans isomerase [Sandaracinaceae bacterium]
MRVVHLLAACLLLVAACSEGSGSGAVGAVVPAPSDVAAPPDDAERTASGLASRVLVAGTGTVHPGPTTTVEVHYSGWTTDGEMFDSSVARGESIEFPLDGVIAGWTEGLQLMVEGESRRLWIPEELAYRGQPGRPAGMLVFDVQLIRIVN